MRFQRDLLVASGKLSSDPATTTMKLCEGVITHSSVLFPPGCAGLVYVQVWLGGHQLIPWSRGEWIRGDDHLVELEMYYPVGPVPRLITIKGYNDDDTYPHTVSVAVGIHAAYVVIGGETPSLLLEELGLI